MLSRSGENVLKSSSTALADNPQPIPVSAEPAVAGGGEFRWVDLALFLAVTLCGFRSILTAVDLWRTDESYSHGVLLPFITAFLIWSSKDQLKVAVKKTDFRGLYLTFGALIVQAAAQLLVFKFVGVWAFIFSLTGVIIWLYGMPTWRIVQFPVLFLLFGAPIPNGLLHNVIGWLQSESTQWAAVLSGWLGFPLVREGNLIQVPGLVLEVADVCSGYHKLLALVALATLYGHMTRASFTWRILLIAAGLPIALCTNAIRIATMVGIACEISPKAALVAHPYLDYIALAIAFWMFAGIGKLATWKDDQKVLQ